MTLDVRANERADRSDADLMRNGVVEHCLRETRADAVALVFGLDNGVREGHSSRRVPVLGEGDHLVAVAHLPAPRIGVIDDLQIGLVARLLLHDRSVSSIALWLLNYPARRRA